MMRRNYFGKNEIEQQNVNKGTCHIPAIKRTFGLKIIFLGQQRD